MLSILYAWKRRIKPERDPSSLLAGAGRVGPWPPPESECVAATDTWPPPQSKLPAIPILSVKARIFMRRPCVRDCNRITVSVDWSRVPR
jgi:hypothetical protein